MLRKPLYLMTFDTQKAFNVILKKNIYEGVKNGLVEYCGSVI